MKSSIFIIFFLLLYSTVIAQKTSDFENWYNSVLQDYKDQNLEHLRSGSKLYNQIKYNLLSDEYFIPIFGESFLELSKSNRLKIYSKIDRLRKKNIGYPTVTRKYPWAGKLEYMMRNIFNPDSQSFIFGSSTNRAYDEALELIKKLNASRIKYHADVKSIKNEELDFYSLTIKKQNIKKEYELLLPSEINSMLKLIEEQEVKIADPELLSKAEMLKNLDNSYSSLCNVNSFLEDNNTLFKSSTFETQEKVKSIRIDKLELILNITLSETKENLSSMNIDKINEFYDTFISKYSKFKLFSQFEEGLETIVEYKTQKILDHYKSIEEEIEDADSQEQLGSLRRMYFYNVKSSIPAIQKLNKSLQSRSIEIENKELRLIAQQEMQRKLEEERLLKQLELQKQQRMALIKKEAEKPTNTTILYENYEHGDIFKGIIEGEFELIVDDVFTYDRSSEEGRFHRYSTLTNICLYYLLYVDKHCKILPENTTHFRQEYQYQYDFNYVFLNDYDDPGNTFGAKYRTEIVELNIDPEHEPIFQFCRNLKDGSWNGYIEYYLNFEYDSKNVDIKRFFSKEIACNKELLAIMGRNMVRFLDQNVIARGGIEQIYAEKQAEQDRRYAEQDRQYAESRGVNGKIYDSVEEPPTFNGGESSTFRDYLISNLKPPASAKFDDLDSPHVKFIITNEGKLVSVKLFGVNKPMEKEILRVVNNSSLLWKPGKQGGKPVNVEIFLDLWGYDFVQFEGASEIVYWSNRLHNKPKFNGGDIESFRKYVETNFKYPEEISQKQNRGVRIMHVSFIVNNKGEVIEGKVLQRDRVSVDVDTEVLRVINSSPKWTPGSYKGKSVHVLFNTFITLKL